MTERFLGVFDDEHTLRFEISHHHSPDVVWRSITDPDQAGAWFMWVVEEPRIGGAVVRRGNDEWRGTVTAFDPTRKLEYEFVDVDGWPDCTLRFELATNGSGDGCDLRFTQELAPHVVFTHEPTAREARSHRTRGSAGRCSAPTRSARSSMASRFRRPRR